MPGRTLISRAISAALERSDVVLAAAQDYTHFMLSDLKAVPRSDPNGSLPIQWPLHTHTINYRWDSDGVHTAYVQLAGNLWGWVIAGIAVVAAFPTGLSSDQRRP